MTAQHGLEDRAATRLAGAALLAACALLTACATMPLVVPDKPKVVEGQNIAPYAIHEECLHLAAGDRLDFYFTTNQLVDFNIHYHEGSAVLMPVVREKTKDDSGVFAPLIAADYCLMWEAGPPGALLDYRIGLRPAR